MPKLALTDARIRAFGPRKTCYDIRDGKLTGFGVRVLPSCRRRFFVHCRHRGERVWRIVGDTAIMDVGEAPFLAAIRRGGDTPRRPDEMVFEAAAEKLFLSHQRNRKLGTRKVNRIHCCNQIPPWFRGMQIAVITRRDVWVPVGIGAATLTYSP